MRKLSYMSLCMKYIGQEGICRSTLLFSVGLQMFAHKQLNKHVCAAHACILTGLHQQERVKGHGDDKREGERYVKVQGIPICRLALNMFCR